MVSTFSCATIDRSPGPKPATASSIRYEVSPVLTMLKGGYPSSTWAAVNALSSRSNTRSKPTVERVRGEKSKFLMGHILLQATWIHETPDTNSGAHRPSQGADGVELVTGKHCSRGSGDVEQQRVGCGERSIWATI